MNSRFAAGLLTLALMLPLATVMADEDEAEVWPRISGSIGMGILSTTGNTDSSSERLTAATRVEYEAWRHRLRFSGYRQSENGETTADTRTLAGQTDYHLSERNFLFVNASTERDRFGAYERRDMLTAGPGRRFIDGPAVTLEMEVGAGRRWLRQADTGETISDTVGRFHGELIWRFTDGGRFGQDIQVDSGGDNTYTEADTWVDIRLVGNLFLRLSHVIKHNSEVAADAERTDTFTTMTLDYNF